LALEAIKELRVNTLVVVPTTLASLVAAQPAAAPAAAPAPAAAIRQTPFQLGNNSNSILPSLRFVLVGGQALLPSLHLAASALMPRACFVQSYACSEACSSITFLSLPPPPPSSLPLSYPPSGCVGQAAHPVEVAILEAFAEDKEEKLPNALPLPTKLPSLHPPPRRPRSRSLLTGPGRVGEIVTRGPHLMTGYWQRPEATAAVLIYPSPPLPTSLPPPASDAARVRDEEGLEGGKEGGPDNQGQMPLERGGRGIGRDGGGPWLRTGDLGMMDKEGNLHLVGRLADVIRSGGEKIMAAEVERVLLEHPSVAGVAVVGLPDRIYGERVVAVVVSRSREGGREEELQAHCRKFLAGYKVPKEVVFRDVLPVTGSGKVRKAVLAKELSVKAQEEERKENRRSFL